MSEKLFYTAKEDYRELIDGRKQAFQRGLPTGFITLDNIASFLPGYQTLVYAPPHVGKTVITMDLLMAQAEMGKNICIYSPEFRDRKEVFNTLIQARLKKSFFGPAKDTITDEEYIEALEFVDSHFVVIVKPRRLRDNSQEKMSIKTLFRVLTDAGKVLGREIHFLFIDPMNYVEKDADEKFLDTQEYVLNLYDQIGEFSQITGVHTILSAHTRDVELIADKDTGIRYYGVLHPSEVMGGQSNYRSSYQILHLWRAPEGVADVNGMPYPANYNKIITQKSKPFGIGKIGDTSQTPGMDGLYFDPDTYTMYEIVNGRRYYRNEYYVTQGRTDFQTPKPQEASKKSWEDEEDLF